VPRVSTFKAVSMPGPVVKATVTDTTFVGGSIGILVGSGSSPTKQYRADNFSGAAQPAP